MQGEVSSANIANFANALTTGRYIKLSGDVVGEAFFDAGGYGGGGGSGFFNNTFVTNATLYQGSGRLPGNSGLS